jgi:cytochrome c-type biogenesis protein CcmH/NrfG
MKMGRTSDALRAYQRALQFDPNNAALQAKIAAAKKQG